MARQYATTGDRRTGRDRQNQPNCSAAATHDLDSRVHAVRDTTYRGAPGNADHHEHLDEHERADQSPVQADVKEASGRGDSK